MNGFKLNFTLIYLTFDIRITQNLLLTAVIEIGRSHRKKLFLSITLELLFYKFYKIKNLFSNGSVQNFWR